MDKDNYIFNFFNNINSDFKNNSNILLNASNLPKLVSNNTKNFISSKLKECNLNKFKTNSFYFNLFAFLFFIAILSIILLLKFKGFNKEKNKEKKLQEKQYIMSKLIYYNRQNLDNQNRIKNNLITKDLDINNHPEASLLHRKIYF
jgi:hypothetical protein